MVFSCLLLPVMQPVGEEEEQLFHNFTDCMKFAMCVDVRKAHKAMR